MSENGSNGTIKYRVGQLEKKVEGLEGKVDKIMTNHLPHIEVEIAKLSATIKIATGLNILAIVLGIILSRWLG